MLSSHSFQLGDSVVVARRNYVFHEFRKHREGRITAVADHAVRVRWSRGIFRARTVWLNTQDPHIQIQKTTDFS